LFDVYTFIAGIVTGVILTIMVVRLSEMIAIAIPWRRSMMSDSPVSVMQIMRMRYQGAPAPLLVDAYIALRHTGMELDIRDVESCYLARKYEIRDDDLEGLIQAVQGYLANTAEDGGEP
jgi:uncharacterized protein YqfA (UPF0365 family)